jgi:hypothetical protein
MPSKQFCGVATPRRGKNGFEKVCGVATPDGTR